MFPRRAVAAVLTLPVAFVLASCTSSGGKKTSSTPPPSSSSAPSTTGSSPVGTTPATSAPAGTSPQAAALVATLKTGLASVTATHFTLSAKIEGQTVAGQGDETLAGGTLKALQATANLPGGLGEVTLVVIDGKTYAKLPKGLSNSGKTWTLITATSSNLVVAQLASFVSTALLAASVENLGAVAGASDSVTKTGSHYVLDVNPAKVPAAVAGGANLGTATIPVNLDLDATGRPTRVSVAFTLAGSATATTIDFTNYNKPVTIAAPPAAEVGTN